MQSMRGLYTGLASWNLLVLAVAAVLGALASEDGPVAPTSHKTFGLFATVFCCPVLGIPAIVFAAQVNERLARGDVAGAQEASRKAFLFSMLSVGSILVIAVVYAVAFASFGLLG